jgi:hypothetical protein
MERMLPILNLTEARYECTYGRGCDGICCREGRPILYPEEIENLDANLPRIVPLLRPEAQAVVRRKRYMSDRRRLGHPVLRNVAGWCIFFNEGCVLHKLGESEGDRYRYKPAVCSLFPIQSDDGGNWYVGSAATRTRNGICSVSIRRTAHDPQPKRCMPNLRSLSGSRTGIRQPERPATRKIGRKAM